MQTVMNAQNAIRAMLYLPTGQRLAKIAQTVQNKCTTGNDIIARMVLHMNQKAFMALNFK